MSIANSENESELADSQETTTSTHSSQYTAGFKKPRIPKNAMLQQEVNRLQEQLTEERKQANHLLRQKTPSTACTKKSELEGEHDRLQEKLKQHKDQVNLLLKQQTLSNTSTGNELELERENERQRQKHSQERGESKHRHLELMRLLKELKD